jgi:hypothetical protein
VATRETSQNAWETGIALVLARVGPTTQTRATTSLAASVDPNDARCAKARLSPSVRLATPVQTEDKPAASDEL